MKKNLFVLATALLLGSGSLFAQEQGKRIKEEGKVSFVPYWYMQLQAGAAHTIGEAKFSDLISPAAAFNIGYQFNPLFGLRAGASGWKAKGMWAADLPKIKYSYNYVQGNVDATLNLSNLFCKYNPTRTFNFYTFLGVAFNHAFDNNEAKAIVEQGNKMEYLWDDSKNFIVGRGGLGLDIRLSDHVAFNVEANANTLSDKFNSKKAGNADWQFNALAGLTIKFGKGYHKTAPVYYADPVPQPEPEPRREVMPEPIVSKVEAMTQNIFFDLDKSDLRDDQLQKIKELAEYLKNHPTAKISITGYADKETGNPKYNTQLSEKRALNVKEALMDKGVEESRIVTDFKGDTIQPFNNNEENRVTICVAEEQ